MTAPTRISGTTAPPVSPAEGTEPARQAWRVVALREVMVKLTDKSFVISTLASVALITGLTVLQAFLASRTETYTVVATSSASTMLDAVRAGATTLDDTVVVEPRTVPDDAAARAAVLDGSADAWLARADDGWVLTTDSEPHQDLESIVQQVVSDTTVQENAARTGVSVADLERGSQVRAALLQGDVDHAMAGEVVGFAFAFLFYMASLVFGYTLAGSVIEEKQSRIVEIIATKIPTRQLLAGKVIGNTALAMSQLVLYLAVGLIAVSFTEFSSLIPSLTGPIVWFVAFFLAGFVMLACLWAVAGSLASRNEDLQSTSGPLTIVVLAVFFGGLLFEGSWQVVASFVPPFSCVVMPIRLVQQDVPWWQIGLSLAGLVVTAALTIRLGERLYRRSLLQTGGGRLSMRQAWGADT